MNYLDHPKVKEARRLLREADLELRAERKAEGDNLLCRCKHRRADHTPTHSINYTAGACHKCDCLHFLHQPQGENPPCSRPST